ncbi:MAG: hypothetical protein AAF065_06165 [Verrucomicrobiota bacterium]
MKLFTQRYESSWLYYFVFKTLGGLALGGALLVLALISIYGTEPFFEGEESTIELVAVAIMMTAVIYMTCHFSVVKADSKGLHIHKNGKKKKKEWNEVKAIHQMPFCTPPVYRISFYGKEKSSYVSVFSWASLTVGFWSWDFTDFKENIEYMIETSEQE